MLAMNVFNTKHIIKLILNVNYIRYFYSSPKYLQSPSQGMRVGTLSEEAEKEVCAMPSWGQLLRSGWQMLAGLQSTDPMLVITDAAIVSLLPKPCCNSLCHREWRLFLGRAMGRSWVTAHMERNKTVLSALTFLTNLTFCGPCFCHHRNYNAYIIGGGHPLYQRRE